MAFWREFLACMQDMKNQRYGADPCLYFKWTSEGLVVWLSWIDDCMIWGPKKLVAQENAEFQRRFECDDVGEVKEYVGCKIDRNARERSIKITQPVLLQSFMDEFRTGKRQPTTPAEAGTVTVHGDNETKVGGKEHTYY